MTELGDDLIALEAEPEPETTPEPEPEPEPEGRCEAETTAGGTDYRCALEANHDGEHSFTALEESDNGDDTTQAASEAAMLAANKKVARSAQTYWESVRKNYGDDLGGFHECPLCVGYPPGLYWPVELAPEKAAALRSILGMPSMANYKRDNAFLTCATCDGLGTVLTGSQVPKYDVHQCVDCSGKGYITHESSRQAPARAPILDVVPNGGETAPDDPPAYDPWGRAYGDPDYGRLPNYSASA